MPPILLWAMPPISVAHEAEARTPNKAEACLAEGYPRDLLHSGGRDKREARAIREVSGPQVTQPQVKHSPSPRGPTRVLVARRRPVCAPRAVRISSPALPLKPPGSPNTHAGGRAWALAGFPEVTQAPIALTLGDEVGRAFFLSGSIATVVIGSLLFYIGYDKIRQKQFMEILRREVEEPEPYREPPC